ncbi:unnamed protein product [Allacma fusca]|uniref:Crossover junction endonuclease MUS81 n=1 Tax=Allacma fusca TaxID=39272 RepID=A0A8J2JSR1_9HEXA|nr:unnamed protein product [Allacma fusca]
MVLQMSQSQGQNRYNKYVRYAKAGPSKPVKQCANPIIEQWLLEWKEEAIQKNSKMQFVYSKALISLRKYPLPLRSGRECKLLEFFGDTICRMIDVRISKEPELFSQNDSLSQSSAPPVEVVDLVDSPPRNKAKKNGKRSKDLNAEDNAGSQDSDNELAIPKKGRKKVSKGYVPAYRSGAYAILVTFFEKEENPSYRGYMLKSEIQSEAQVHCDSSFMRPDNPGSKYTAWSSMGSLVTKGLVMKQGTPVKFMLTMEGRELAGKLINAHNRKNGSQAEDTNGSQSDISQTDEVVPLSSFSRFTMNPGEFEVILVVDNCETNAKSKEEEVIGELRKNGVNLEIMKLNIGDFVWICRDTPKPNLNNHHHRLTISRKNDLVLPFVVERKRGDDLASSIKDGRFHEQKMRLTQSGLSVIYLIEGYVTGKGDYGLGDGALSQAIANTQITNEFMIHETTSIKDTCAYLTYMTRHLSTMYQGKKLLSCSRDEWPTFKGSSEANYLTKFLDFNEFGVKQRNWTVSEMFVKHLLRLRGLSVDKAQAIVNKYPTLQALLRAYSECVSDKEKELMLAHVNFGSASKTIGPMISRTIFQLYRTRLLI